jgi:hypothetical protein
MPDSFQSLAAGAEPSALNGGLWARRVVMAVLAVVAVLALLNAFGQRASTSTATGQGATLGLRAPTTIRGGLLFESRVDIVAQRTLEHPRLVLDSGWIEGMQVNSITPDAESQASRDGDRTVLSFPALQQGRRMRIWLQFQVDPTSVGHRPYGLELDDAETRVARLERDITVLP